MLSQIYTPAFKDLNTNDKLSLALSGLVWWKHSNIQHRVIQLSPLTLSNLNILDQTANSLAGHDPLLDSTSHVRSAFRLSMTHNSTAMEGNVLSLANVASMLDQFGDGIAQGIGISETDQQDFGI